MLPIKLYKSKIKNKPGFKGYYNIQGIIKDKSLINKTIKLGYQYKYIDRLKKLKTGYVWYKFSICNQLRNNIWIQKETIDSLNYMP